MSVHLYRTDTLHHTHSEKSQADCCRLSWVHRSGDFLCTHRCLAKTTGSYHFLIIPKKIWLLKSASMKYVCFPVKCCMIKEKSWMRFGHFLKIASVWKTSFLSVLCSSCLLFHVKDFWLYGGNHDHTRHVKGDSTHWIDPVKWHNCPVPPEGSLSYFNSGSEKDMRRVWFTAACKTTIWTFLYLVTLRLWNLRELLGSVYTFMMYFNLKKMALDLFSFL